MLGLGWGIARLAVTGAGGFRPETLLPAAFYDVAAPGACWQDSAGTIPALDAGDPVGWLKDLSGGGRHLTQSAPDARPLLRVSGGRRWLEFDGVDDFLAGGPVHGGVRQIIGAFASATASAAATNVVYGARSGVEQRSYVGYYNGEFAGGVGARNSLQMKIAGNTRGSVIVGSMAHSAGTTALRRNGITGYEAPMVGNPQPGAAAAMGGLNTAGSVNTFFQGTVHALIDMNRLLTPAEEAAAEAWLAGVAGIAF